MNFFTALLLIFGVTLAGIWGTGALVKYGINQYYDRQSELNKKKMYTCLNCKREDAYEKVYEDKHEHIETRKDHHSKPDSTDPPSVSIGKTYKIIRYDTTYECVYCGHTKVDYREYQQRL